MELIGVVASKAGRVHLAEELGNEVELIGAVDEDGAGVRFVAADVAVDVAVGGSDSWKEVIFAWKLMWTLDEQLVDNTLGSGSFGKVWVRITASAKLDRIKEVLHASNQSVKRRIE
ncbi:hypothetical protein WICPIJ_000575 [Wickerhamomyces pijperi]|uniref:Uncharacterized protein n=1 Tax=Wickerhamomyces pijperi TaxID=599730 RepID=A0A9P8QDH3_WICPI|nr:hypothetical protein WICPIJ_000575 [Wickerhamomyces pijperi]